MADTDQISPTSAGPSLAPFETLQQQTSHHRRARPPALQLVASDENRIPLRADRTADRPITDKMQRRESRLNLRNIFGRSKTPKDVDEAPLQRELNRSGGIRNSLAEFGNWPSYKQSPRSEITPILESHPISPLVATHPPVNHDIANKQRAPASAAKPKTQPAPYKSPRGHLATWDPPPLFQAYPQAIKYAHLPAPILSADTILRHNERKGSLTIREDLTQLSPDDDPTGEKAKKHRREPSGSASKQEWTTKIYVLCTSGYLLQYSGEGHFDRLPEKMLQLSKDSAAFVSDALPGRHWVLQVSSAMEADGMTSTDSRSLFSRLPFRVTEKRSASNYLMVFEGAEDMESWITILRREIEALGGKKNTTETGRLRMDGSFVQLKSQSSQRTLVVRDPSRFSRVAPPEFSWHANKSRSDVDSSTIIAESDAIMDPSIDDVSTTNSVTSNEGRQLDSLRDSANRLSYISSGQRTIVTSTNSSPACSPIRDAFNSPEEPSWQDMPLQLRPRPNAAAIMDRRQSMQTMNFGVVHPSGDAQYSGVAPEAPKPAPTPNFSVPICKRYSLVKSASVDSIAHAGETTRPRETFMRPQRRAPPTALSMARPLSIVTDHPSPVQDDVEATGVFRERSTKEGPQSPSYASIKSTGSSNGRLKSPTFQTRRASFNSENAETTAPARVSPRKYASMHSLRSPGNSAASSVAHMTKSSPPPPVPRITEVATSSEALSEVSGKDHGHLLSTPQQRSRRTASVYLEAPDRSSYERPARYSIGHMSDLKIKVDSLPQSLAGGARDPTLEAIRKLCQADEACRSLLKALRLRLLQRELCLRSQRRRQPVRCHLSLRRKPFTRQAYRIPPTKDIYRISEKTRPPSMATPAKKHDWADDEDVDEVSTELPPTQTITNKDGTKTIITFRLNEQNQKVKTTRRIRYTTHTEKVNPRVAERKGWSKFGLSAKDPAGPAFDTTTVGENIIFRPSTNWRKDAKEEAKDPNAQAMKDKLKDKQKGSYVPPALRGGPGGAAGAGERMGGKFGERDDLATLRVTNVSEMAEEQELRDMFERFGRVTRVFLAKDRETGMAKGFAFISFVDRSDAVKACAKMDGFGFKHLILRVEFAKKAT
ncbi:hypothetical protein VdG1_07490 [Verticillium dahliae VDG1]|nr:hypothetical protein VdG1_07490 [Verticillium dahliae VDG1]